VCSQGPIEYDAAALRARIAREPFRSALAVTWRAWDLEGFLAPYLAGPAAVQRHGAEAGRINTDDQNWIEYGFARTMGRKSGFSLPAFRRLAVACGAARPPVRGDVRWVLVEDHYQLRVALLGRPPPKLPAPTPVQTVREAVFEGYARSDFRAVAARWEARPYDPVSPAEAAVLALALARVAGESAKVGPLLARVRKDLPVEAEVIEAVLAQRQGKTGQAADRLVAVFARLREKPWIMWQAGWQAMAAAEDLASEDPAQAARLYAALAGPLAGEALAGARRLAAFRTSRTVGAAATVEALAAFEPNVPWEEEFLVARQNAYEATGHPLAARAARDVELYRRNALSLPKSPSDATRTHP
jgi:hypothetical protein